MKLPHLRRQFDSAFRDNEPLLDICQAYAEATSYRDQLRHGIDPTVLAEYDLICSQLEAEAEEAIVLAKTWTIFDRKA